MIDKVEFNAEAVDGWVKVEVTLGPLRKRVDMEPEEADQLRGRVERWLEELNRSIYKAEVNRKQTDLEGEPIHED